MAKTVRQMADRRVYAFPCVREIEENEGSRWEERGTIGKTRE